MKKEDGIIELFGNKYKIGDFNHETGAIEFTRIKKGNIFKRLFYKIAYKKRRNNMKFNKYKFLTAVIIIAVIGLYISFKITLFSTIFEEIHYLRCRVTMLEEIVQDMNIPYDVLKEDR